jgi:uncharacterized protein YbjT (DUF2867 family)
MSKAQEPRTHMNKVILFGGTGRLGTKVAQALKATNYEVTAVVRNEAKAKIIQPFVTHTLIADVTNSNELKNSCQGFDVVISTLGKSVSPNDLSKPTFEEIDLTVNSHIIEEAQRANVKKMVYISAFGAETLQHLAYFKTHYLVEQKLMQSGINYSIVKPVAIMSSFIDIIDLAKKGLSSTFGKGDKLTNPIYEGDLATICVASIQENKVVIEAGGNSVYSRKEINEIIQQHVAPHKRVWSVPFGLLKIGLPVLKIVNKNMYDKFAFYAAVMQHDTIAPKLGETTLETYLQNHLFEK